VRATDARFLEIVRGYLEPFRADDGAADSDTLNRLYSANCGEEKMLPGGRVARPVRRLYLGTMKIFQGPSNDEMAGRLISSVRDLVTAHTDEFVRVRAGGVVVCDQAVILPSPPEPHLPALVGLLVAAGAGYLGDELLYLDPVLGGIHGLPFPLLIDSLDLSVFPQLERERGGRQPRGRPEHVQGRTPRRPVAPVELGGAPALPAELGRIVMPTFAAGERTELVPLDRAEALFRLSEAVLNLHIWADRALILLRSLVEAVPVERLVVGSLPEAAALLLATTPSSVGGGEHDAA
jgi:hypothetical protein